MSGGSAANTMCGVASFGGRAAYIGKVAADGLGEAFRHDLHAEGVHFANPPARAEVPTGRCLIVVTPDAQRTMNTFLGVSSLLGPDDVSTEVVAAGQVVYMEGYLYDRPEAKEAYRKAAAVAHGAGRKVSLTLSDSFCVDRHRDDFLALVRDEVDVLFANDDELRSLYGQDRLDGCRWPGASGLRAGRRDDGPGGLADRHPDDVAEGEGRAGRPTWSTPPAPATSTPPASSTGTRRVRIWPSAAGWGRWPRPRSSATSAPGRSCPLRRLALTRRAGRWPLGTIVRWSSRLALVAARRQPGAQRDAPAAATSAQVTRRTSCQRRRRGGGGGDGPGHDGPGGLAGLRRHPEDLPEPGLHGGAGQGRGGVGPEDARRHQGRLPERPCRAICQVVADAFGAHRLEGRRARARDALTTHEFMEANKNILGYLRHDCLPG